MHWREWLAIALVVALACLIGLIWRIGARL